METAYPIERTSFRLAEQLDPDELEDYITSTQHRNSSSAAKDLYEGWHNTERALLYAYDDPDYAMDCAAWAAYDLGQANQKLESAVQYSTTLLPAFIDTRMAYANWPTIESRLYGQPMSPNQIFKFRADFVEIARFSLEKWRGLPRNDEIRERIMNRVVQAVGIALLAREPETFGLPHISSPRELQGGYNVYTFGSSMKRMRFMRFWCNSGKRDPAVAILPLGNILNRAEFEGNPHRQQSLTDFERTDESFRLALHALEAELQEQDSDTEALDRATWIIRSALTAQLS